MRIRPLYDRILAERIPKEDKTSGVPYIPANIEDKSLEALIVSIGTGKRLEKTSTREIYAFASTRVGRRFIEALAQAAGRDVKVKVFLDGWGSAHGGRYITTALRESGCGYSKTDDNGMRTAFEKREVHG